MIIKEIRDLLNETCEDSIIFENPSFDKSIIGISTDGSIIYSLFRMIKEFAKDNNCSDEEALEFIDYNTIRAMSYITDGVKPTIVDDTTCDYFEIKDILDKLND